MKNKTVSNTSLGISKILNILEQKELDLNAVDRNWFAWTQILDSIKRAVKKKASIMDYELDFGSADFISLQNAATDHLNMLQSQIGYEQYMKRIFDSGALQESNSFSSFLEEAALKGRVTGILRDVVTISAYWATILKVLEADDERASDLNAVMLSAIREELKNATGKW